MSPTARGTLYCILSAVSYTMMGICQRELSENCDPVWVNSVQATGFFNLFGFLLLTKVLQLTAVVRVNVIANALTTALTVLAGIIIFAEPANRELIIGIVLILSGMFLNSINEPAAAELETAGAKN